MARGKKKVAEVITKGDLVQALMEQAGISRAKAYEILKVIFNTMSEALESGKEVRITNFGSFSFGYRKERVGRNPKTGEELTVPARKTVRFKPCKRIREALVVTKGRKKKK